MRKEIGRYSIIFVGLIAGLLLMPIWASADLIFELDTGNTAISGYPGPYATVDVHLIDTTHASITFTSLTNSGNIYLMGDGGSVAVNVNADSWELGTLTGSNSGTGFTTPILSDGGAGNEDGFGVFNQKIDNFDGFTYSADSIIINLINTTLGGMWADATDVLTANANGALAGAHIFVTDDPAVQTNGALVTGFAAGTEEGGPPPQIPEPGTIILVGGGLLAFAIHGRKRMQK